MESVQKYRLRVANCIGTIMDVHKKMKSPCKDGRFLSQFEALRKMVQDMDMSKVSENDVLMVEKVTNALLGEFNSAFDSEGRVPVYKQVRH
ncbi:MAG: hypothetical protein P8175_04180 [Deltaproteobacteria bacterium]|jgi:hypothetical protein